MVLCAARRIARVAELADAPDLGSGGETCAGSSPASRTRDFRGQARLSPFCPRSNATSTKEDRTIKFGRVFRRGRIHWIQYSVRGTQYRESSRSRERADAKPFRFRSLAGPALLSTSEACEDRIGWALGESVIGKWPIQHWSSSAVSADSRRSQDWVRREGTDDQAEPLFETRKAQGRERTLALNSCGTSAPRTSDRLAHFGQDRRAECRFGRSATGR